MGHTVWPCLAEGRPTSGYQPEASQRGCQQCLPKMSVTFGLHIVMPRSRVLSTQFKVTKLCVPFIH